MAVLVGGNAGAVVDSLTLRQLTAGTVTVATATNYRITVGTGYDQFTGNFTYTDGVLTGGTITGWTRVTNGGTAFTVTGLSLPVAVFLNHLESGDTIAFLGEVFDDADSVTGTALGDHLAGFDGNDKIAGGGGDDLLVDTDGADTLDGGAGNDLILGGNDADSLIGGTGNDSLAGEAGANTLAGGAGNDYYVLEFAGTVIQEMGGQGIDVVTTAVNHQLADNVENLVLLANATIGDGNGLANLIAGNDKNNKLSGGEGNDTLDGGTGADTLTGGIGNDLYVVDDASDDVVELAGEGKDTVQSWLDAYTLAEEVENLTLLGSAKDGTGNTLANLITGNDVSNDLSGDDGNDTIQGGDGNDTLAGGSGDDSLAGGIGSDTYIVSSAGDKVSEAAVDGYDQVQASVDYTLTANVEALILAGFATKGTGNSLSNIISGNGLDNTLQGGTGDDWLLGAGGDDSMAGGAGNDRYYVDDAGDIVAELGGGGADEVSSSIDYELPDAVEALGLTGTAKNGTGNGLANEIEGNGQKNELQGLAGNDTLRGLGGDDTLIGGTGDDLYTVEEVGDEVQELANQGKDTVRVGDFVVYSLDDNVENAILMFGSTTAVVGNELNNSITGNEEDNDIAGSSGNDTIDGGKGNDFLSGGGDNDSLIGGEGYDTLTGAAGADTLSGGLENDDYVVDNAGDKIVELANGGINDEVEASVSYTLAANVETLTLTGLAAIDGTGNGLDNHVFGNAAANKLQGLGGVDTLSGDDGDDVLDGGAGDDFLWGDKGDDSVVGGTGNDSLLDGDGQDTLAGGIGDDNYTLEDDNNDIIELAGQGNDVIRAYVSIGSLADNVENLVLFNNGTAVNGTGNGLHNYIQGNSADNKLWGLDGNDTLDGSLGDDTMTGGAGNDTYDIDSASDVVVELANAGSDTLSSSLGFTNIDSFSSEIENLTLASFGAITGVGNELSNKITGSTGDNILGGVEGNDTVLGGIGDDTLDGGSGDDSLDGGTGDDELSGSSGKDTLIGGDGHDILSGDSDADLLIGGTGNDHYEIDNVSDKVTELAGQGADSVVSSIDYTLGANLESLALIGSATKGTGNTLNNVVDGNGLANLLSGGDGHDYLFGDTGADTLNGGNGNDFIDGGTGADSLIGGAGNDVFIVDNAGDAVSELAGQGSDTVQTDLAFDLVSAPNVENLTLLGNGNIDGKGSAVANRITGNGGKNELSGLAGNDTLDGGAAADTLIGGLGNDVYVVDEIFDEVQELAGQGIDTVQSHSSGYSLGAEIENLQLLDGADNGSGNSLNNLLTGNDGDNLIAGNGGNDTLNGASGNDTLIGGAGNDAMAGGLGNDRYEVLEAGDKVTEVANQGTDEVISVLDSYTLGANLENLTLAITAGNGTGNGLANVIEGNGSANKLSGLGGNDELSGESDNDTLDGGDGNDELSGGLGIDSLLGGNGNDSLDGGAGIDHLAGGKNDDTYYVDSALDEVTEAANQGIDTVIATVSYELPDNVENLALAFSTNGTGNALNNNIIGGFVGDNAIDGAGGNDTLIGGFGTDTLTGGTGRDRFQINAIHDSAEQITDFQAGVGGDMLDLADLLDGFDLTIDDPNDFVQFVNAGGDTTVRVDADGAANGAIFVDVVVLQNVTLDNVAQAMIEGNLALA